MPGARPHIFVTRPIPAVGLEALQRLGTVEVSPQDAPIASEELRRGVAEADAMVCMLTDRIDGSILDAAPRLKVVANFAAGTNNLDLAALRARGIPASHTPGVLADATAELAMGLLLDLLRGISSGDRYLRQQAFPGWGPLFRLGEGLAGKQLGIIGLGSIGRAMAARARAFGMRIVYHQRHPAPPEIEDALQAQRMDLDRLLASSDVVSLHCPLTEQTRQLLDASRLAAMKPGAYLLNTARGELVDEAALVQALEQGSLAGAALDVFAQEPKIHPGLIASSKTVLSPHLGSATLAVRDAMALMVAKNIEAGLAGKVLPNAIATH
jgi:glyoxylate reductase